MHIMEREKDRGTDVLETINGWWWVAKGGVE
jgi:hypothetical protein